MVVLKLSLVVRGRAEIAAGGFEGYASPLVRRW
jgi:hypothetical protein